MLKVISDARVLEALSAAFPKPPNSARRALEKYCNTLSNAIAKSLLYDLNPYRNIPNLYSVSLHNLANTGGQIGANKIRLHSWLEQNKLSLIDVVGLGSNIAGRNSLVKLSSYTSIDDSDLLQNARNLSNTHIKQSWLVSLYFQQQGSFLNCIRSAKTNGYFYEWNKKRKTF